MEQIFPCLYPNSGWRGGDVGKNPGLEASGAASIVGKHCILELYECDASKLNDEAFLRTTITTAAKLAGATLLNLITHRFEPQGVTGLALLAESHISIHTWPENSYAAADVFTCGDHTMPVRACEILCRELAARDFSLKTFQREAPGKLINTVRNPHPIKRTRC